MTSVATTVVRMLVILIALAGAAGHVAYLDALWWHSLDLTATVTRNVSNATIVLLGAHAAVSLVCAVLSIALVLHEKSPRAPAARALGVAYGAWSYLMAYSGVTMLFRPTVPGLGREVFEAHFLLIEVLGLVGVLRFTTLFPRPLLAEELAPLATLPPVLLPFHRAAVFMRRPWAPASAGAAVLAILWSWTLASGTGLGDAGLSRVMDLVRLCAAGLAVMNLRRAWDVSTEGDRDGLTWLLVALSSLLGSLALLIGGNVLVAVTGFPDPRVAWRPILLDFGFVGFLVGVAGGVLHRGRIDPGAVARRVMTATLVVTAGLVAAAGLEALFATGVSTIAVRRGVGTAIALAVVLSTYRTLARAIERVLPV